MINPTGTALSAIRAFERKAATTAHNVANLNTDGFKANRVVMEASAPGGVRAEVYRVDTPGAVIDTGDGSGELRETSNVNLARETGSLIVSKQGHKANLKTLQTCEEMTQTVIDLLA